ncbi:hypothetical protein, partial [Caballeronia sp.]|uniref:hypothetical protein n=1 Tax=Caballeronia sp. TaxID=1931223 RepID=UPI003C5638DF
KLKFSSKIGDSFSKGAYECAPAPTARLQNLVPQFFSSTSLELNDADGYCEAVRRWEVFWLRARLVHAARDNA